MVIRVASFFPFQTTYYLNGHSCIEQELNRNKVGFRKNDNAFLAVDDGEALQATADRLSPQIIRKQLDYWTFHLFPTTPGPRETRMLVPGQQVVPVPGAAELISQRLLLPIPAASLVPRQSR